MYGQPQVSSASVNLTTETAVVWPVSEAKVLPNWQKNLGVELAKHLTSCGFKSNLRGEFLSVCSFNFPNYFEFINHFDITSIIISISSIF